MGGYVCDETNDRADDAYDRERQEATDDGRDWLGLEAKRRAAGYSPEELFLEQVMNEGMRAGLDGRAASENPYQSDEPANTEWERCRRMAAASKVGVFA